MEGSRAELALSGLLPGVKGDREEMARLVTGGRYQELKMLIYIGRDLQRWAEQCVDFVNREPELRSAAIREQSFVTTLINRPPASFADKMAKWGITDQRSIFSRAIGLNSVFDQPPPIETLSTKFLQSYQRYADYLFICYQTMVQYKGLEGSGLVFELYASEEYAKLLADGWNN